MIIKNFKSKILRFSLTLAVLLTLFSSCKKIETANYELNVQERFFKVPFNATPSVLRVINDLKLKNDETPFVENFVASEGYPLWEFAKIKSVHKKKNKEYLRDESEPTDSIIEVPVVLNGQAFVKSILSTKLSADLLYKLFESEEYASYGFDKDPNRQTPNADDIVAKFMSYESEIWGEDFFKVNDNRLFDYWGVGETKPESFFVSQRLVNYVVTITYVCEFTTGGQLTGCPPGVSPCYELVPVYCEKSWSVWADDGSDDGVGGGWTTTPPYTTGGGGTSPSPEQPEACNNGSEWVRLIQTSDGTWVDPCTNHPVTPSYSEYMSSIDNWNDLDELNDNLAYGPYETYNLRNHGQQRGWDRGVAPVVFNARCGRAFEQSALEFFDLPHNCQVEDVPQRALKSGGAVTRVRPDALTTAYYYKPEGQYTPPTIVPLYDYICTEVKAVTGVLKLSDNNWQILGELEVLSRAKSQMNNPSVPSSVKPVLFLITTANTIIDQSIIDEANTRGIMVWQSKALYDPMNCCKLTFTPPIMMNFTIHPGIDFAPKSFLGSAGIFASPQVLLEPTPDCDDIDPESID